MSYFPSDIPYMTDEELEEHGINAKRERNEMSYISEKIDKIHANTIEIKSAMGNTIIMLDNIKSALKADVQSEAEDAYQRGLDDAWEAVRKIVHMPEGDLLNIFTECYSAVCTALQVLLKYDASEAIAKLKSYEEKQKADDEIKVGDIVDWSGDKYIVSYINNDGRADLIYIECGSTCESVSPDCFTRTGKHYDITKILEEMRK